MVLASLVSPAAAERKSFFGHHLPEAGHSRTFHDVVVIPDRLIARTVHVSVDLEGRVSADAALESGEGEATLHAALSLHLGGADPGQPVLGRHAHVHRGRHLIGAWFTHPS